MINFQLDINSPLREYIEEGNTEFSIHSNSPEEKVRLLIFRDLLRLGWGMNSTDDGLFVQPPGVYDKKIIRDSMQIKRQESLLKNARWIRDHIGLARNNLANGNEVWKSQIKPFIEVCETQKQFDIFRIFRYYWSSPYSEYVGRRIKLLIRDSALPKKPIIGIAAIGSSIIHIPDRDSWIEWDKEKRTKNLIYAMDAYVLGALPPYNYLLGGKLISYIIASNEVRKIYERKYKGIVTNISKRTACKLACIFTTSLYGLSSQYNRMTYNNQLLYLPIGHTKGFGTLHITNETFNAMRELLESRHIMVTNKFGDGPIWRMRVIRTAADILGINADFLLKHSFQRGIYAIPLAHNFREFLKGEQKKLNYYDYPLHNLVEYWKERWLNKRKTNIEIQKNVYSFRAENFCIE